MTTEVDLVTADRRGGSRPAGGRARASRRRIAGSRTLSTGLPSSTHSSSASRSAGTPGPASPPVALGSPPRSAAGDARPVVTTWPTAPARPGRRARRGRTACAGCSWRARAPRRPGQVEEVTGSVDDGAGDRRLAGVRRAGARRPARRPAGARPTGAPPTGATPSRRGPAASTAAWMRWAVVARRPEQAATPVERFELAALDGPVPGPLGRSRRAATARRVTRPLCVRANWSSALRSMSPWVLRDRERERAVRDANRGWQRSRPEA